VKDRAHTAHLRSRKPATILLYLCAALSLTACGSSGDSEDRAEGTPTPTRPPETDAPADPQAAERKAVLQAYSKMWDEQVKAYRKADLAGTDLDEYAAARRFRVPSGTSRTCRARASSPLEPQPTRLMSRRLM
jgi:hypothetical protein